MKKLNIGILIDQLFPGGVQKSAIHEARELIKMGHQATLLVLIRTSANYHYQDLTTNLTVIYLSDYNPLLFKQAIKLPFFSFLTHLHFISPYFVRRYKFIKSYDFLISHGTTTCITASAITRTYKIPYLSYIWDPMVYILTKVYAVQPFFKIFLPLLRGLAQWYERDLLLSAALVVTSSKVHQKFLQTAYQVNPRVIPPGININRPVSKQGTAVLGFSRWQLAKNPQFFLQLARRLPNVNFLLAGHWPKKSEFKFFQAEIKQLGLTHRLKLISKLKENDLIKLAKKSFVWVHPHPEAFGMGGLEMAALGLPLIMPHGSGVTELFKPDTHGFFPKQLTISDYARHIIWLKNHPRQCQKMGQAASRQTLLFTWTKHTRTLLTQILKYQRQTKLVVTANAYVATKSIGGGDRFFIEHAARLPRNIHLTVITPKIGYVHFQNERVPLHNIRFISLIPNIFDGIESPIPLLFAYLIRAVQTYQILKKLPNFSVHYSATDIIPDTLPAFFYRLNHTNNWTAQFFHFYASPFARYGTWWINLGSYLLQRLSLAMFLRADQVLIDNHNLSKNLRRLGISEEKIKVVTGGADITAISSVPANPKFISDAIFIGRLSPHKGIYDALEIWKYVVDQNQAARLTIIGYTPSGETKILKNQIKSLGLTQKTNLVGFVVSRQTLYSYLRSSKLLLFLDHEAGFGLVVAEAMAAGLPVVAYNLPLFSTVYKQGFRTVPFKDNQAAARAVNELLTDYKTYSKLSKQAQDQAQKFDWNVVSQKFYQTVIDKRT